ncbi:MAG TPA: cupredoxin domain-containing protein [Dehalococcoidia bacterium]
MLWRFLVIPVLALALAGAAACGDDDDSGSASDSPTGTGTPTATVTATPAAATETPPGGTTADATAAPSGEPTGAPTESPTVAPTAAVTPNPNARTVVARDFAFDPITIGAQAGVTVEVGFANVGTANHTFTIDELDVDLALSSGESRTVEFAFPDQAIEFYCRIHPVLMRGTLEPGG